MVYKSLWHAHIPMETSKRRQELKLDERGHGDKCTFLALGDSVLNDLPALRVWSLPLCTRQIHIHPKTGVVFVFAFVFFWLPTHTGDPSRKAALFFLWAVLLSLTHLFVALSYEFHLPPSSNVFFCQTRTHF